MNPKRIQRRRVRGWRMPAGAVSVARPSKWGNPFRIGEPYPAGDPPELQRPATREDVLDLFDDFAHGLHIEKPPDYSELRGKDLACWCSLCPTHANGLQLGVECADCAPCHAMVLLTEANK